jgi:formate-dependent nitrite reductase membrane component NrfD
MLIKTLKPFSFWHSWLLPLLFTVSGIAAGAVLVLLLAAVYGFISAVNMSEPLLTIVYYLNFLLLACIVVAALYIGHAALSSSLRSTVLVLIKGRSVLLFWAAFVLLGLVLPLVAGFYLVSLPSVSTGLLYTLLIIIALCVMTGGYVLRYLVLTSGTAKAITASGQQVELHETAFIPVSHRVKYRAE